MARIESQSTLEAIEASLSPESLRWYRQFPKVRTREGEEICRDLAAPKRPLWTFTVENTFWLLYGPFAFGLTFNPLAFAIIIPISRNINKKWDENRK